MDADQGIWFLCGLCRLHAPRPRQRLHADLRLHHDRRAGSLHQSMRRGGVVKLDLITKKQDEFYTPRYAVVPILKYVPSGSTVLCPFDTSDSNFVKMLRGHGCTVTHSHIVDGLDFWKMSGAGFDFVISNPPYSCKGDVLQRLFEWNVPFAMLIGVVGLFESQKRFEMFKNNTFEIMYLNRRVSYFEDYNDPKPKLNPPFSSVYLTSKMLPQQIVFEEIDKYGSLPVKMPRPRNAQ